MKFKAGDVVNVDAPDIGIIHGIGIIKNIYKGHRKLVAQVDINGAWKSLPLSVLSPFIKRRNNTLQNESVYLSHAGWLVVMDEGRACPVTRLTDSQITDWESFRARANPNGEIYKWLLPQKRS